MKIKEVCSQTGLTERAVRLYLEKGLVCPASEWRQGRTYYDYNPSDVEKLKKIAALRSAGFSLENIRAMLSGGNIENLIQERTDQLKNDAAESARNLDILENLSREDLTDGWTLAGAIQRKNNSGSAADLQPDFGRWDGLTRQEKISMAKQARKNLDTAQKNRKKFRLRIMGTAAAILLALGFGCYWCHYEFSPSLSYVSLRTSPVFSSPVYAESADETILLTSRITFPGDRGENFLGVFRECSPNPSGIFPDTEYLGIQYSVRISRHDAKKLNLMADNGKLLDAHKVEQQILSSDEFCFQYLTILSIQALGGNISHQKMPF